MAKVLSLLKRIPVGTRFTLALAAAVAAGAAFVFWGCWSTAVACVAPDDPLYFPLGYGDVLRRWWNGYLATGKALPTDLLWSGLLGSPLFCRELKYAVAVFFAALGLAYFLRGRGLVRPAAYGAGLLLAFSGYWFSLFSAGHGGWFVWMTYGLFAFGLVDRAVAGRGRRYWLLLGLDVAWAGYQQQDLWLLFSLFTFAYLVFRLVRASREAAAWGAWLKGAGLAAAVFVLVGLPNFLSVVDVVQGRVDQIARGENITTGAAAGAASAEKTAEQKWEFVTNWSLPADETIEFVSARANGDTSCPYVLSINALKGVRPYVGALGRPLHAKVGNYRQHSLYVGWVTVLLALAGVLLAFRPSGRARPEILFFTAAALLFYALSLGRYFEPVYRCVFALPAGDLIRCPVKWHHLTEFCLCVLAGYGLDALARSRRGRWAVPMLLFLGVAGLVSNARLYCAGVDYSRALARRCSSQLAVLSKQDFSNPRIAEMARRGIILSVAHWLGNPDAFLVQVLEPCKPELPQPAKPLPLAFGIVSALTAAGVFFVVLREKRS